MLDGTRARLHGDLVAREALARDVLNATERRENPMVSKKVVLASCLLLGACSSTSQTSPPLAPVLAASCEGGEVRSDEQLAAYARCSSISGDLKVSYVTTLASLDRVRQVGGALRIENTVAESLEGLEALESIATLTLANNRHLDDISQLSRLSHAHAVVVAKNPDLRSLRGLSGLSSLERLTLHDNGFYSLDGLEQLTHVGELSVIGNRYLINMEGLNGVRAADRARIEDNPRLSARFGLLAGLDEQAAAFSFERNAGLSEADTRRFRFPESHAGSSARRARQTAAVSVTPKGQ